MGPMLEDNGPWRHVTNKVHAASQAWRKRAADRFLIGRSLS